MSIQGEPRFEVKWEGWDKKSDRTWETEDNLQYVEGPTEPKPQPR